MTMSCRSAAMSGATQRFTLPRRTVMQPPKAHLALSHHATRASKPQLNLQPVWRTQHALVAFKPRRIRPVTSRVRAVAVQANIFDRIFRVVKAYVDSFVGGYEDPEVLLNRITEEMQGDILKLRQASAQVMAAERQMNAKYKQAQENADEWVRRAELAVRKGEDDLAREALRRRKAFQETADKLKAQMDLQKNASEQLQSNLRMLEGKLSEARNKKETLKARAAAARSSKEIQDMLGGLRLNNSTAWAAFEKMEEKVVALEAEASTAFMLSTPDTLERRFEALEGGAEDELAALKRSLGAASKPKPAAQLPASVGRPLKEALGANVEYELEELRRRARA